MLFLELTEEVVHKMKGQNEMAADKLNEKGHLTISIHTFPDQAENGELANRFEQFHYPNGLPSRAHIVTTSIPHPGTFGRAADIGNVPVQWTDTIANDGLLELANRQMLGGGSDAPLVGQPGAAIAFLLPQHPFILVVANAAALDVFLAYLRGNLAARFGGLVNLAGFSYSTFTIEANLGTFNG